MGKVLVIDDEPAICWGFQRLLRADGHTVSTASSAEEGIAAAEETPPDAVILDVRLPGIDGLTALPRLREVVPGAPVVLMTAFGNLDTAVRAIEAGVIEYLPKPFELEDAVTIIRRVLAPAAAEPVTSPTPSSPSEPDEMIGSSRVMQEVFKRVAMAAAGEVPVVVTGESGTGKELVARAIHRHSRRHAGPFIAASLAALSPTVLESELFGHVRGAFTGAESTRLGLLERADGGTVFLDEIGDVPLETQVKLLRAIERKEVQRVGDSQVRPVDFRVIAATHCPLPEQIAAGKFREDLYYRLSVFGIALPPLRERGEDIPTLAAHFLARAQGDDDPRYFSPAALGALQSRRWPGNVRELRNAVEHAALVSRGREIGPESLPAEVTSDDAAESIEAQVQRLLQLWAAEQMSAPDNKSRADLYARMIDLVEPGVFQAVLAKLDGNRSESAQRLGIHRTTLREKLRRHGLDDARPG